jgi:putative membrane protein
MNGLKYCAAPALMFLMLLFGSGRAQPNVPGAQTKLSDQDRHFLEKAFHGDALQIELGRTAGTQAITAQVREFATTGAQNFAKADSELRNMAAQAGYQPPSGVSGDIQSLQHGLATDNGGVVDEEYVGQILPATVAAVNLFKDESENGGAPALRQFALNILPQLEDRKHLVEALTRRMGGLVAGEPPLQPMRLPPEYAQPVRHG